MSSSSVDIDLENARIADTDYLIGRAMIKGNHILSIITPPIYIGFYLFRKRSSHITVNRVLRATWLGGFAGMHHRTSQYSMSLSHILCIQVLVAGVLLNISGQQTQVQRHFALAGFAPHSM